MIDHQIWVVYLCRDGSNINLRLTTIVWSINKMNGWWLSIGQPEMKNFWLQPKQTHCLHSFPALIFLLLTAIMTIITIATSTIISMLYLWLSTIIDDHDGHHNHHNHDDQHHHNHLYLNPIGQIFRTQEAWPSAGSSQLRPTEFWGLELLGEHQRWMMVLCGDHGGYGC